MASRPLAQRPRMVRVQNIELADYVLHIHDVICQQPWALFCRVSFVLYAIVQGTIPVLALEDLLEFVLFLAIYLNRRQGFRCCMPIGYIWLQQQHMEDVITFASLL